MNETAAARRSRPLTQQFNTATSMGRLVLNMLLSFAQFEREVTAERIRDKIAASKKKGLWLGGSTPLGYDLKDRRLVINEPEAAMVRTIFELYRDLGRCNLVAAEVARRDLRTKRRVRKSGQITGDRSPTFGHIELILRNPVYFGRITRIRSTTGCTRRSCRGRFGTRFSRSSTAGDALDGGPCRMSARPQA